MTLNTIHSFLSFLLLLLHPTLTLCATTLIPTTALSSLSTFNSYFSPNYPWGPTHNGAAYMSTAYSSLSSSILTLTAVYSSSHPTSAYPYKLLHFLRCPNPSPCPSPAVSTFPPHSSPPTTKGTWPAFWLTATSGWPPEIDIAEWKGDGKISFNTFNTSSQVAATDVTYANAGSWHTVEAELRDAGNGVDVKTTFYLDGVLKATQVGKGYVGRGFWLIIDLQMEGSSGSPGPTTNTTYQIKDLSVVSYN